MLFRFLGPEIQHRISPAPASLAEPGGDGEGQLQVLIAIQPGITHRLVAVGQVGFLEFQGTTDALGDVVSGQFDVKASRPGTEGVVDVEETANLLHHVVEGAGLVTVGGSTSTPKLACTTTGTGTMIRTPGATSPPIPSG